METWSYILQMILFISKMSMQLKTLCIIITFVCLQSKSQKNKHGWPYTTKGPNKNEYSAAFIKHQCSLTMKSISLWLIHYGHSTVNSSYVNSIKQYCLVKQSCLVSEWTVIWPSTDYGVARQQHSCPFPFAKQTSAHWTMLAPTL